MRHFPHLNKKRIVFQTNKLDMCGGAFIQITQETWTDIVDGTPLTGVSLVEDIEEQPEASTSFISLKESEIHPELPVPGALSQPVSLPKASSPKKWATTHDIPAIQWIPVRGKSRSRFVPSACSDRCSRASMQCTRQISAVWQHGWHGPHTESQHPNDARSQGGCGYLTGAEGSWCVVRVAREANPLQQTNHIRLYLTRQLDTGDQVHAARTMTSTEEHSWLFTLLYFALFLLSN
jgi:hypothetical protein